MRRTFHIVTAFIQKPALSVFNAPESYLFSIIWRGQLNYLIVRK